MSLALELWRALEAWDPDRHPRGPGGRFIKLGGGGGSSRPSLADAVKGTAASGPKRQRGEGGMSVADAVRHAARTSDTTGRPTQRSTAEHRAHGAHSVADEVDRALVDTGAPEDVRHAVSGRARLVANSHGPRPTAADKKMARLTDEQLGHGLEMHGTDSPTGRNVVAEMARRELARRQAVKAAPVRAPFPSVSKPAVQLPSKSDDGDVDLGTFSGMALLSDDPEIRAAAEKMLERQQADRKATEDRLRAEGKLHVASQEDVDDWNDMVAETMRRSEQSDREQGLSSPIYAARDNWSKVADNDTAWGGLVGRAAPPASAKPPAVRPAATKAAKTQRTGKSLTPEHAADTISRMRAATTSAEARAELDGLTAPQLRDLAKHAGVFVPAGGTKQRLSNTLYEVLAGRRLDADAINRL